jgi:hypothetical protein
MRGAAERWGILQGARMRPSRQVDKYAQVCTHPAILVLCAGHGGCGTLGCVSQLRDTELIDDLLELSRTAEAGI